MRHGGHGRRVNCVNVTMQFKIFRGILRWRQTLSEKQEVLQCSLKAAVLNLPDAAAPPVVLTSTHKVISIAAL